MRGANRGSPESASEGAREWHCDVCDEPADHVVGVAAVVGDTLRFWLGGCCPTHEEAVRNHHRAAAREIGLPEITVMQVLKPAEVEAWVRRLQKELAQQS
jgi:hypothetical protein